MCQKYALLAKFWEKGTFEKDDRPCQLWISEQLITFSQYKSLLLGHNAMLLYHLFPSVDLALDLPPQPALSLVSVEKVLHLVLDIAELGVPIHHCRQLQAVLDF